MAGPEAGVRPRSLRDLVRHEVVARQLGRHLPEPPPHVLDVDSGGPAAALRLARAGSSVLLVEPCAGLRDLAARAFEDEPEPVRARLTVTDGVLGSLADVVGGRRFDAVTCHRALGTADGADAVVELADLVAPGGVLSVVAPNADGTALAPAMRGRWADALDLLHAADDPQPRLVDEHGSLVRAHRLEELASYVAGRRMRVEAWYGVGALSTAVPEDEPPPDGPDDRETLFAAEELAGRTDPYRRVAPLIHLVGRRAPEQTHTEVAGRPGLSRSS